MKRSALLFVPLALLLAGCHTGLLAGEGVYGKKGDRLASRPSLDKSPMGTHPDDDLFSDDWQDLVIISGDEKVSLEVTKTKIEPKTKRRDYGTRNATITFRIVGEKQTKIIKVKNYLGESFPLPEWWEAVHVNGYVDDVLMGRYIKHQLAGSALVIRSKLESGEDETELSEEERVTVDQKLEGFNSRLGKVESEVRELKEGLGEEVEGALDRALDRRWPKKKPKS